MAIEAISITLTDDLTLDDILDAANEGPVRVERDGIGYTILREAMGTDDDIWKDYDPQAVIDMLEDLKHNPIDDKISDWINEIYRWREEGSRQDDRP